MIQSNCHTEITIPDSKVCFNFVDCPFGLGWCHLGHFGSSLGGVNILTILLTPCGKIHIHLSF